MRTQIEIQKLEQQFEFEVSMTFEFNNQEMGVSVRFTPDRCNHHTPVAQKIADQRLHIANLAKIGIFLYKMM